MLFGLFGKKDIDMRTVAYKQEAINEDLKCLKKRLSSAHAVFDERYAGLACNYKSKRFDAVFDPGLYGAREFLSSCDFYLKRVNEHYGAARYTGFTPFSSFDVFNDLFSPVAGLFKAQVMLLTCALLVREQTGLDIGSSKVMVFSDEFSRFIRALVKSNNEIGKGDKSPSGLKIRKFLELSERDSAELVRLVRKKGLSLKDIEACGAVSRF